MQIAVELAGTVKAIIHGIIRLPYIHVCTRAGREIEQHVGSTSGEPPPKAAGKRVWIFGDVVPSPNNNNRTFFAKLHLRI